MYFLSSLSIKTKILSLTIIAVIGFVISLLINFNFNTANAERLHSIQQVFFPTVQESKANIVRLLRIEELLSTAVSTGEMDFVKNADKQRQDIDKGLQQLKAFWPERSSEISLIQVDFSTYFEMAREVSVSMVEGTADMALVEHKINQMNMALEKAKKGMEAYSQSSLDAFNDTVTKSNEAAKEGQSLILIVAVIILAVMIGASVAVGSLINSSLMSLLKSLKGIASGDGDLTQRIAKLSDDEIGQVVDSFNQFIEKLHHNISELVHNSAPLSAVAQDMRSMTASSSHVAEEQNTATEKVSRVVDDMVISMRDVSSHAESAASAAQSADGVAKDGSKIVAETVKSINSLAQEVETASEVIRKLEADTKDVGSILDVIRGIAEQTNLLALNAAIEAARAGEQGRGFAVVADEVRTLASRTQESTKEIQTVIEQLQQAARSAVKVMDDSKDKASKSVAQAAKTGDSLTQITTQVESIKHMNSQIASATNQQEQAANSIKDNVLGIKSTAEETMASIYKVDAASKTLNDIAQTLRKVTGQFRV
ncbi:MAG: hypothetical protein RL217_1277 [Pseudomonadota bacterium]|jgi:methyl-accepting chemotaxis protein